MPPAIVLDLTLRPIEMLQTLHRKRIVHADLKPSNILVSTSDIYKIYIVDFGMAEFDEAHNELLLAGTNRYLHPLIRYGTLPPRSDAVDEGEETLEEEDDEVHKTTVRRRRPTSISVPRPGPYLDIYATGIIAFEMLTGGARAPFPMLRDDFMTAARRDNPWLRDTSLDHL